MAVIRVCNAATVTQSNQMALALQSLGYVVKALPMTFGLIFCSIVALRVMVVMARRSLSEYPMSSYLFIITCENQQQLL